MAEEFFGPLPDPSDGFDFDKFLIWLGQQTIAFDKIITGSLQATQVVESANFVTGSSGWQIDGDGSAEFQNVTIRGTLNADDITLGLLNAARIGAGTIGVEIIKLSNSSNSRIESNDGTSLIIRGDGSAVFTNITATGQINATTGTLTTLTIDGNITLGTGGIIRTAASGQRVEIAETEIDRINFYTGDDFENLPGFIRGNISGVSGSTLSLRTTIALMP